MRFGRGREWPVHILYVAVAAVFSCGMSEEIWKSADRVKPFAALAFVATAVWILAGARHPRYWMRHEPVRYVVFANRFWFRDFPEGDFEADFDTLDEAARCWSDVEDMCSTGFQPRLFVEDLKGREVPSVWAVPRALSKMLAPKRAKAAADNLVYQKMQREQRTARRRMMKRAWEATRGD